LRIGECGVRIVECGMSIAEWLLCLSAEVSARRDGGGSLSKGGVRAGADGGACALG